MKYKNSISKIFCFAALLSAPFLTGCSKEDLIPSSSSSCSSQTTNSPRSVNFFDFKTTSPYFNQVVASFKFNQSSTSYSGGVSCPSSQCSTTLLIQNVTVKKIIFDYKVTFTLNFVQWNYQGVAVIDPGAMLNVGEINSGCTSLALGQIVLQSTNVTYQ
jgi:hypothetical protein